MKSKIVTFFLFIIMIGLIAGFLFVGWAIYNDLFTGDVIETLHTGENLIAIDDGSGTTTITRKKSIGETIADIFTSTEEDDTQEYSSNGSIGKFFYEQLNTTQKSIYNGLQENKENMMSGTYKIEFGNKFYDVLNQENGSDILGNDYQTAIEAFTHDNPDLFYIDVSKMYLNMETRKKAFKTTYNVFISPEENQTYYANGFNSENSVKLALKKIEKERDYVLSKLTKNTYKDIKIIHDYLIDNLEYDEGYKSLGTYTIYGALVDHRCVCEGYTRAFKYLADAAGIKCVLIQGTATNKQGKTEKHAWNAVNLRNTWYLIDTTWDDPIIVGGGVILSSTHYRYFLKGSRTFAADHISERQFTEKGKFFDYPNISESDY